MTLKNFNSNSTIDYDVIEYHYVEMNTGTTKTIVIKTEL